MTSFNNFYYLQYATTSESEPDYDSDNPEAMIALKATPSQAAFFSYLEDRKSQEQLYKRWVHQIDNKLIDKAELEKICGMRVVLTRNKVRYVYKSNIELNGTIKFKFRICFIYIRPLRKWYYSPGYSFLPEIIEIEDKLKSGTFSPIKQEILTTVSKIKDAIENFMENYIFIFKFIDHIHNNYPNIEVIANKDYTSIKMLLMEDLRPKFLTRIDSVEAIVIKLIFIENFKVDNIVYEFIYNKEVPEMLVKKCKKYLEEKLEVFFEFSLYEAFNKFMSE